MVNSPMTLTGQPRAHGGDLDRAIATHGGARADWLDLSTGVNPHPWPVTEQVRNMPAALWHALPGQEMQSRLLDAARAAYAIHPANQLVAASGTQALIQLMPRIAAGQTLAVHQPSYNEHRGVFSDAGWTVVDRQSDRADAAVVVNPNNPDGMVVSPEDLLERAGQVGTLIVDEAFADMTPDISLCPRVLPENVLVLRSFGKFFGLAGLRLGFAVGAPTTIRRVSAMLGPWSVSGPAQYLGAQALADQSWIGSMKQILSRDCARLQEILQEAGLTSQMGTDLFQTIHSEAAGAIHEHLARARIWTRAFPYSPTWLRLGLPGPGPEWARLEAALARL